jgi:hypothetical protein
MSLSKKCVESLLDLVDNKLTSIQVFDRDDAREVMILETCKRELQGLLVPRPAGGGTVVPFTRQAAGTPAASQQAIG